LFRIGVIFRSVVVFVLGIWIPSGVVRRDDILK